MSYLVDTNVLSEVRRGGRADPGVRSWFAAVDEESLYTSVLVLGEIRCGIEAIRRRDPLAALALEQWLKRTQELYSSRILPVDTEVANRWGALNVPDRLPTVDGLLAATALEHGLTVVTRNTRGFTRTGVPLLDPFA